jgi:hypothetical protein
LREGTNIDEEMSMVGEIEEANDKNLKNSPKIKDCERQGARRLLKIKIKSTC